MNRIDGNLFLTFALVLGHVALALGPRPLFDLHVHVRDVQHFVYSPVLASGYMVVPTRMLPQIELKDRFFACISMACMYIFKKPETVCSRKAEQRTSIEEFMCRNRHEAVNASSDGTLVRFETIELGYANAFPLGRNTWTLKVYDDEGKTTLLGVDVLNFMVEKSPKYSKHHEFQFIAEKGESIAQLTGSFCGSVEDNGLKTNCFKSTPNNLVYDLNCRTASNEWCQPNQTNIDVTSVYGFAPQTFNPVNIHIDGKPYNVNVDAEFRVGFCRGWSDFCKTNGFSSNVCVNVVAGVTASLEKRKREEMLNNPYFSQVDMNRFYQRYTTGGSLPEQSHTLATVHFVMSDLKMKKSGRDAIVSSSGWGNRRDVIFFNQRELFRTLLTLFDETSPNFRPCMEWLVITLDETYVGTEALDQALALLSPSRPLYLGNPIKISKRSEACRYYLANTTYAFGVEFASFSGGIVLSRGLLELLKVKIMPAPRAILLGYDVTKSYCYDFDVNDARLGGCLHDSLGISLTVDRRFGGTVKTAPICPIQKDPKEEYVTLPFASPGLSCRKQRDHARVQTVLNGMVRAMTTYSKDRINAVASIWSHVNSSTYRQSPGHPYVFTTSQILVFDDPGTKKSEYPAGIRLFSTPACTDAGNDASFHCVQEKMSCSTYALASYVLEHTEVQFGIFGDSDQSLNLVAIAESLADRIDPSELLMVGDVKWGHSQYPYVSGGAYVQTRAWFLAYHKYASAFYEQWGVLPLMGKLHDRRSTNGIHGCDSFFTYVTYRMGGDVVHLPGFYGYSILCVAPNTFWHVPVLAHHGMVSNKSTDTRYGANVLGPKFLNEADEIYEEQESNRSKI